MIPYKPSDGETKTSRIIKRLRAGRRAGQRAGRRAGRRARAGRGAGRRLCMLGGERSGDCARGRGVERRSDAWEHLRAGATLPSSRHGSPRRHSRRRTATERRRKAPPSLPFHSTSWRKACLGPLPPTTESTSNFSVPVTLRAGILGALFFLTRHWSAVPAVADR